LAPYDRAIRATLRVVLTAAIAALAVATHAAAQPTIGISETCVYSGGRFVVFGNGFDPGQSTVAEIMSTHDPRSGEPIARGEVTADARGDVNETMDVPPAEGIRPVGRAVRFRPNPDAGADGGGAPTLLATTPLKTALRNVSVLPAGGRGRSGLIESWRVTGLPDGVQLFAHYRHDGRTIATRWLATAREPCGQLKFNLRVLPDGHERSGRWDLWITAKRRFRVPRKGVYIHRRMTAGGDGGADRVELGSPEFRLLPVDARAPGPITNSFAADATRIGVIKLIFNRAEGSLVEFFERIGDRIHRLGGRTAPSGEPTILDDATTWSCDRLVRRFFATAILPDGNKATGAHTVRTASCADRFRLSVPRRIAPGARANIRVGDRWGIGGIRPRLCITPPRARPRCRRLALSAAVTVATRRLRVQKRGLWTADLRIREHRIRESFAVGSGVATGAPVPRVLTTGDSMMQGIDSFLGDELGDSAKIRSDVHVGAAISRRTGEWEAIATEQMATVRPQITVISIGAAEGFPMTTPSGAQVACCDESWVVEYSRRVRAMMTTYLRGGAARVFWLTVPLPRLAARLPASTAVNDAIVRAGAGQRGVTVLRMDLLFSPAGYQDAIRYRGRRVRVREIDAIHLNVAGTAIAAQVVADAIRERSG
jgi:hypothetical protein